MNSTRFCPLSALHYVQALTHRRGRAAGRCAMDATAHERPAKRARVVDESTSARVESSAAVHSLDRDVTAYARTAPLAVGRPKLLTSFSYSPARELLLGPRADEALSHYRTPPLGADLNRGLDRCVWRDETEVEGLDALLDWSVSSVHDRAEGSVQPDRPALVTARR